MVFQVSGNGGGFFAGVGEDRQVEPELRLGFTGQEEQGGALDADTEVEDVVLSHHLSSRAGRNSRQVFDSSVTNLTG